MRREIATRFLHFSLQPKIPAVSIYIFRYTEFSAPPFLPHVITKLIAKTSKSITQYKRLPTTNGWKPLYLAWQSNYLMIKCTTLHRSVHCTT